VVIDGEEDMQKIRFRLYCETSGEECDGCEWQNQRTVDVVPPGRPVTKCGTEGLNYIRAQKVEEVEDVRG